MLTARGIAMAVCAFVGANALADGDTKGSPTGLEWLRAEVGDGALIHHSDGRIYLTELATADSVLVGNGNQPEFSPDGTKFAWIDGTAAKGRLRRDVGRSHGSCGWNLFGQPVAGRQVGDVSAPRPPGALDRGDPAGR